VLSDSLNIIDYNGTFINDVKEISFTETDSTITFGRIFNLDTDMKDVKLLIAGENISVIANYELIAENISPVISTESGKKEFIEINIPELYKGENIILIKSSNASNKIACELNFEK
jgi:hypothetical protein